MPLDLPLLYFVPPIVHDPVDVPEPGSEKPGGGVMAFAVAGTASAVAVMTPAMMRESFMCAFLMNRIQCRG